MPKNAIVSSALEGGGTRTMAETTEKTWDLGRLFDSFIVVLVWVIEVLSSPYVCHYGRHSYRWSIFSHPSFWVLGLSLFISTTDTLFTHTLRKPCPKIGPVSSRHVS